jgi:catechol 2,3-dioxygenase-like lactoylglutathione lyase family enzyme
VITGIASVSFTTQDFPASLHFYQDILGLKLISQHGDVPQLQVGNGILVLVKGKLSPATNAFPLDFPLLSLEVSNLDESIASLIEKNIEFDSSIEERRDSRWINVCDPSGNLIQLVEIRK